jgi:hypothetical protein
LQKYRPFGEIPQEEKTAQISLSNYNLRAEWHGKNKSATTYPTITIGSQWFPAWHEYFAKHLGGFPWAMRALMERKIQVMTVPEERPEWFDPSFTPDPRYRPQLPDMRDDPGDREIAAKILAELRASLAERPPPGSYPDLLEKHGKPRGFFE